MKDTDIVSVLRLVDRRLNELGLRYMVGGSVASSAFGEPRMTRDVDLVIESIEDSIIRKLEWFRNGGEVSDQQWRDVISLIALNSDALDSSYLARWSERIGVRNLLEKANRQVMEDPGLR